MAGTTTKSIRTSRAGGGEDLDDLLIQFNKVIADLETLRGNSDLISRNRTMANAAIARGTTAQKVKTVNSISYAIDGALLTKAGTDDFWTLGGAGSNTVVAGGFANKYLLLIDSAGAASVLEGTQAALAANVVLPALPASKSVVGVLTVATAGATFVPGTTALNAGTVTATFTNGLDAGYFSAGASALTAAKIGDRAGTVVA